MRGAYATPMEHKIEIGEKLCIDGIELGEVYAKYSEYWVGSPYPVVTLAALYAYPKVGCELVCNPRAFAVSHTQQELLVEDWRCSADASIIYFGNVICATQAGDTITISAMNFYDAHRAYEAIYRMR